MSASNDGSESVDHFLARIASLSNHQDGEDAERNRKMEEEMMKARKERQARRAERARSISPVKTGPTPTLSSLVESKSNTHSAIEPPVALTPRSRSQAPSRYDSSTPRRQEDSSRTSPVSEARPLPSAPDSPSNKATFQSMNASSLSRSGTLSWQQRPSARSSPSVRSRPTSATPNIPRGVSASSGPREKNTDEMSRRDIAESLGSKDPSWFRQTPDRGTGSLAYRRNDSGMEDSATSTRQGMKLPGMSRDSPAASTENSPKPFMSTPMSASTSFPSPGYRGAQTTDSDAKTSIEPMSSPPTKSIMLDAPTLKPFDARMSPEPDASSINRSSSILSSTGRPPSPTKGLGGFVQSAMMKRSDSVSKRWSVQAAPGLKRGDSVAGSRPASYISGHSRSPTREQVSLREGTGSPLSGSRPVSRHGTDSPRAIPAKAETESPISQSTTLDRSPVQSDTRPKPSENGLPERPSTPTKRPSTPPLDTSIARSPSKTMDPKRWSPTKSSWLESALSKPESPRAVVKSDTPAWKLDRQRSKGASEDSTANSKTFGTVSTTGLLKSTPMGDNKSPPLSGGTDSFTTKQMDQTIQAQAAVPTKTRPPSEVLDSSELKRGYKATTSTLDGKQIDQSEQEERRRIKPVSAPKPTLSQAEAGHKHIASEAADNVIESKVKTEPEKRPPPLKPKPATPPKQDFRGSLRSRQAPTASGDDKEPEFLSMFGKLKRAQTQNYQAPDVLKDNIARGKAALNVTGGPQKTKRVDEFKESILQKKEAMKAGEGSVHHRNESANLRATSPEKPSEPIPEALARRKTLHRTAASRDETAGSKLGAKASNEDKVTDIASRNEKPATQRSVQDVGRTSEKSSDWKNSPDQRKPTPRKELSEPIPSTPSVATDLTRTSTEPAKPVTATSAPENSKLAARLNPALAGILSRSNSPRPQNDATSIPNSRSISPEKPDIAANKEDSSGSLTHMTKGRAKGPKRRAPKSDDKNQKERNASSTKKSLTSSNIRPQTKSVINKTVETEDADKDERMVTKPRPLSTPKPRTESSKPATPSKTAAVGPENAGSIAMNRSPPEHIRSKPLVANKSPELRKVSDTALNSKLRDERASSKPSSPATFDIAVDKTTKAASLTPATSPQAVTSEPRSSTPVKPLAPSKSNLNSAKQPKPVIDNQSRSTPPKPGNKPAGLGLDINPSAEKKALANEPTPPPDRVFSLSHTRMKSLTAEGSDKAKTILEQFFGKIPQTSDMAAFDTQIFLGTITDHSDKTRTLKKQIWEVNGDGKKVQMPPQQEHILYEDCMYLCVHSFRNEAGAIVTETYLWCGDEVADAAVEDAQLFCRKVAKENNAKLEVMRHGKEDSRFCSALGGIVIIRRSKSSALYMLCGRRHLGHVTFDEVDFSSSNLCSGFAYIISAKFGKLYLWKGKGSGADEIGCARLIGMDLGLTGEIEEVSEGEEPASFWDAFPSSHPSERFQGSSLWSNRDQHKGYPCRLYRVEHDRPKSSGSFWGIRSSSPDKSGNRALLEEIVPFCQKDLNPNYLYILDNYFHIYLFVGDETSSKPAEFATAMKIAHEMTVLAPSVQDRSLLPTCFVVFGEPPEDFRTSFRKWTSQRSHAKAQVPLCLRVEDFVQIIGL